MVTLVRMDAAAARATLEDVRRAPVFAELNEEALAAVGAACRRYVYEPGTRMVGAPHARDSVFVVAKGGVRLYRCSPDGIELTLEIKHAGDLFDVQACDRAGDPKNLVEALDDGAVVYAIPRAWFLTFARSHPSVLVEMAHMLAGLVRAYQDLIEDLALCTVEVRVAHALARLGGAAPAARRRARRSSASAPPT